MPLSFPAHQAAVVPFKLARPGWFDGTALVVAAAAPDLYYAFGPVGGISGHHWTGLLAWVVPFTLAYVWVLRWGAADGLFRAMPNLGPLRLRSYRALSRRRPNLVVTLCSSVLGGASHIAIDSFTHGGRWGSTSLDLDIERHAVIGREVTTATLLQYLGHTAGSLLGVALFVYVASGGPLDRWYGTEVTAAFRREPIRLADAAVVACMVALAGLIAVVFAVEVSLFRATFVGGLALALGLLTAGVINQLQR